MTNPPTSRLPQIDGLRGFAAMAVLLFHYTTRFDDKYLHVDGVPFSFVLGSRGVELFFVISGFVIFMTLDATRRPLDFVVSRVGRLFPTYWTAMVLTTAVAALAMTMAPGTLVSPLEFLVNLTMMQSLFGVEAVDSAYWSLEVELIFYAWMLLLATLGWLVRVEWVLLAWLTVCMGDALLTVLGRNVLPYTVQHFGLLNWLPWFALGMMVYRVFRIGRLSGLQAGVAALAFAAIALRSAGFDLVYAAAWVTLVWFASQGRLPVAGWRVMTFLGAISYPLYLVHQEIGFMVMLALQGSGWSSTQSMVAALGVALLLAWGLHRLVEKPSMRAVSRWRARRGAAAGSGPAAAVVGSIVGPAAGAVRPPATPSIVSTRWALGCALVLMSVAGAAVAHGRMARAQALAVHEAHLGTVNTAAERGAVVVSCEAFDSSDRASGAASGRAVNGAPVILVLGQSNAASQASDPVAGETVRLLAGGQCLEASDPLPGTTGDSASVWTALDRQWTRAGIAERPWFAIYAVGGSAMHEWSRPGPLRNAHKKHLASLALQQAEPDAIVWQQGEADMRLGTGASDWLAGLHQLRQDLDGAGFRAPLMVARSTFCRKAGSGAINRGLDRWSVTGQLPERVLIGANTDTLGPEYRRDGCHFNARGREAAARLWLDVLSPLVSVSE